MDLNQLLIILLVGLVAGFLASHVMSGHGYGLIGDIVVGILGALIGSFLLAHVGIAASSLLGQIVIAFIGAVILLFVLRLATRGGRRRGRFI